MAGLDSHPEWLRKLDWSRCELGPPAPAEAIDRLEQDLEILLPERYRDFLRFSGGLWREAGNNQLELCPIVKHPSVAATLCVFGGVYSSTGDRDAC